MILVVKGDGTVTEHEMPGNFLKFCYDQIGCNLIDRVRLTEVTDLWVDDEGMYTQETNAWATLIANSYGYPADYLFGTAVITGTEWTNDGPGAGDLEEKEIAHIKGLVARPSR